MTAPRVRAELSGKVFLMLLSLLGGVLVLALVFILAMWRTQAENGRRDAELRRDLCSVTEGLAVPTPLPTGPAGERARALIPKMDALRKTTCDGVRPAPIGTPIP